MRRKNPVFWIILVRTLQASGIAAAVHLLTGWPWNGPHALGLFLTPALCLYFVFVFVAPWSWGLPILDRLKTDRKVAVLTFDDGPSATTAAILDCLREHKARAVFFVLGAEIEHFPDLIRRMHAEGHTIGVHAWHHQSFVGLGHRRIAEEVHRTQHALRLACPAAPPAVWLRPPHGFKSLHALRFARTEGMMLVAWSDDPRDYRDIDSESIAQRALQKLRPGAIILLHDGPGNRATVNAVPLILNGLQERGFFCVPLERDS